MVRFYLSDVAQARLIGHHSISKVIEWCNQNNVQVYIDENEHYMGHVDFVPAFNDFKRQQLMEEYPRSWKQRQTYYNIMDISEMLKKPYMSIQMRVVGRNKNKSL